MAPVFFLLYPLAEIYSFYRFIEAFSFFDAVLWVLLSGFLGMSILAIQGKAAIKGLQASLNQGKIPGNEILHRGLIMFGGFLLLIPGIISDVIGFLCILPISRHLIASYLKIALAKGITRGRLGFFRFQQRPSRSPFEAAPPERDAKVVEITPLEIVHQNQGERN